MRNSLATAAARLETRLLLAADPLPFVESIAPDAPQASSTAAFTVTFSERVTGVDAADFALAYGPGVSGGSVTRVAREPNGAVYHVTVRGIVGNGALGLNLIDNDSITDFAGNHLTQASYPFNVGASQDQATADAPASVALSDLNGDGNGDLVTANRSSNSVSVLLGNGNGGFLAKQDFPTGSGPTSVAAADFNGDGELDLVTANSSDGTTSVLLGNGNGTFRARQDFQAGAALRSVAVGDFNVDGRPDLVVTNDDFDAPAVSVLLGNGDGSFQPRRTFAAGPYAQSVAIGDLNGDGHPDLVTCGAVETFTYTDGNSVSVLLGNGDGTFQAAENFSIALGPRSVAVADVTGDGKLDVVTANYSVDGYNRLSSSSVSVLPGNGDGTFRAPVVFNTPQSSVSVAVQDVNADGHSDLVTANVHSDTVSVLRGNGNGTFQPRQDFNTSDGPASVAIGDVDGDGLPDVVTANRNAHTVSVLAGNGDGTFQGKQDPATGDGPASMAAVDVNGDGNADLVAANFNDNSASVLVGNGDGTFQAKQDFATGDGPFAIAAVDVNGDGNADLVAANFHDDSASVLLGNGDGTFQTPQDFATGDGPVAIAAVDVNGDGNADIVTANFNDESASVLLGNGDGTFQPPQDFATDHPLSLAVADVNGDGQPDVVTAGFVAGFYYGAYYNESKVSVLLGNGDGTLQAAQDIPLDLPPRSVAVVDVNADGKPDIVAPSSYSDNSYSGGSDGEIYVLLGNGDGTFQPPLDIDVDDAREVAVGDVNGDGKPDLFVSNDLHTYYRSSYAVTVLVGQGDGTFSSAGGMSLSRSASSVALGDMTGDGKLDLVWANERLDTASVLINKASGGFVGQTVAIAQIAPVLGNFGSNLSYAENAPPRLIASAATVTDADSINFNGGRLTVRLTANGGTFDRLGIRNQGTGANQIHVSGNRVFYGAIEIGVFAGGVGLTPLEITLNANAKPLKVQALLRNITFSNLSETPATSPRTVSVQLTDGVGGTSLPVSKQISVTSVNDRPVIGDFGPAATYSVGGVAVALTSTAIVSDIDSLDFGTGKLVVKISSGAEGGDRLEVRPGGDITVVGNEIRFAGTAMGAFTGGTGLTALTIQLNDQATRGRTQALLRAVTYRSISATPSITPRTVQAQLFDGDGGASVVATKQIAFNVQPVIGGLGGNRRYTENGAPLLVAHVATVADSDSANFDAGRLTVKYTAGGLGSDRLTIRHQGTGPGQVGVSGNTLSVGGVVVGTFAGGTGLQALVVTFNADAKPLRVQAVLRTIQYQNVSDNPTNFGANPSRTINYVLTDGDGATSVAVNQTLNITSMNDATVVGNFADASSYPAGAGATILDANATLMDVDSANFAGGNLVLMFSAGGVATNRLAIRNQGTGANQIGVNGSNVTFAGTVIGTLNANGGIGLNALIVTFTPAATPAAVQALLRNLTYRSTAANPTGPKTLTLKVRDGDGGLTTLTKTLNIVPALAAAPRSSAAFASYAEWEYAL